MKFPPYFGQKPHLAAGAASAALMFLAWIGFNLSATGLENRYVSALIPFELSQTLNGTAEQRAALHQPDLLLIFGSSEVTMYNTSYEASRFFRNYPTGFAVMDVANGGAASLTIAQDLAALGPDLRGKKIIISMAPATFLSADPHENYYVGNYSRLHAYGMIFSPYLSLELKHKAAQAMLAYPDVYQNDPLLLMALRSLAGMSPRERLLYDLIWPLGETQIQIMQLQDHANEMFDILSHANGPAAIHISRTIDWNETLKTAHFLQKVRTSNNLYGVEHRAWSLYQPLIAKNPPPGSGDAGFIRNLSNSSEWANLRILLDVLQQLGARPLILSRPMNFHLLEAMGISQAAQGLYYTKLHQAVDPYHFPLVDFQSQDHDIFFSVDAGSHTSPLGWVYIDQVLDQYFHGELH